MGYTLDFTVDTPDNTYKVPLEGVLYNIRLRWNTLSEAWHMSIGPAGGDYVVQVKVRSAVDFFNKYRATDGLPPGIFTLVDTEKTYGRPSIDNIGKGKRFQFFYRESTEI